MGDLIVMSRAKPLPAREMFVGHSAEILFFTGVRYYRMDESADVTVPDARVKRRRTPEQRRAAKQTRERRKALA